MKIFKYELKVIEFQLIQLPFNSKVLCVKNQRDNLVLYAEVPDKVNVSYRSLAINIFGTGCIIPEHGLEYIDTVLTHDGTYAWHIYI